MAKVAVGWGIEPNPGSGTVELLSATVLPLLPVYDFCLPPPPGESSTQTQASSPGSGGMSPGAMIY